MPQKHPNPAEAFPFPSGEVIYTCLARGLLKIMAEAGTLPNESISLVS